MGAGLGVLVGFSCCLMVVAVVAVAAVAVEGGDAAGWSAVVSESTGECLDTILPSQQVDLYACVSDGHNERFRMEGGMLAVGPGDEGPGGASRAGWCLRGLTATQTEPLGVHTSVQAPCNKSDPQMQFAYEGKVLRSGASGLCLQAGAPANDTPLLLAPCVVGNKAQQWTFKSKPTTRPFAPPIPPPPPPPSEPFLLDPAAPGRKRFDGHGGLSAGASSRLLYDYPEPARSEILDYLYKPNFGAGLTMCKVEIGGDGQSTNGAEASHMHTRTDLNFDRGYEYWLMAEAKKRNPRVTTYGLSWAAPGWINNGSQWNVFAGRPSCPSPAHCAYFSADNIEYQTKWVIGAKRAYNITIDYLGLWNERPWGTPAYVKALRASLDAAGFHSTQIVGSDGSVGPDEVAAMKADPAFSAAVPILGVHYPCKNKKAPASMWQLPGVQKVYWSSEDNSGISGNWAGGGCWGRSLLQNFVKVNATSTISWSTVWAAYEPWMYLGSGLGPSAWEPWSGNYSVYMTVWTSAHVGQFSAPGWYYLGGDGTGLLPGGGSYTAMVPPASGFNTSSNSQPAVKVARTVSQATSTDITVVIEKLEGACLRCQVPATVSETVSFQLASAFRHITSLVCWLSNSSTQFVRVADVPVHAGVFTVHVERDTMMTLTTTIGQHKGIAPGSLTARYQPFPFPFEADFKSGKAHKPAKYFADNEGSFEVLPSLTGSGYDLGQTTPLYPMLGYGDVDPISSFGAADWSNYGVATTVQIVSPRPHYAEGDTFLVDPDPASGILRKPTSNFPYPGWNGIATCKTKNCSVAAGAYAGVCARLLVRFTGICFLVGSGLAGHPEGSAGYHRGWTVVVAVDSNCRSWSWKTIGSGALATKFDFTIFHNLSLSTVGRSVSASLDGNRVFTGTVKAPVPLSPAGLASIRTGYHYARFSRVSVFPLNNVRPSPWPRVLFDKHLLSPPHAYPGGSTVSPVERDDMTGLVGCAFTLNKSIRVAALGRFASGTKAAGSHTLYLMHALTRAVVANVTLRLPADNGTDLNGYAWSNLTDPVELDAGGRYYVLSSEVKGGDSFFDRVTMVQSTAGLLRGFANPVYHTVAHGVSTWVDAGNTTDNDPGFSSGNCYGPLNVMLV